MSITLNDIEHLMPSNKDKALAEKTSRILADYIKSNKIPKFQLLDNKKENKKIVLPFFALQLLIDILVEIGKGNAISLVPIDSELTTQKAANLLNVSRPYLINLLNEGKISFRKVGTKRRILAKDVIKYKKTIDSKRIKAIEALCKQAQDLNLGY